MPPTPWGKQQMPTAKGDVFVILGQGVFYFLVFNSFISGSYFMQNTEKVS